MRPRATALVLALAACAGKTLDGGTTGDRPLPFDLAAKCASRHGPPELPQTAAAFSSALVGRWLVCGSEPTSPYLLLAHDGFELTADGRWFALKPDGFGGYQHTFADGTDGQYGLYAPGGAAPLPASDSHAQTAIRLRVDVVEGDIAVEFEVNPRRILTHGSAEVWLVRFDDAPDEPTPYRSKLGEHCDGDAGSCRAGLACEQATLPGDAGTVGLCASH